MRIAYRHFVAGLLAHRCTSRAILLVPHLRYQQLAQHSNKCREFPEHYTDSRQSKQSRFHKKRVDADLNRSPDVNNAEKSQIIQTWIKHCSRLVEESQTSSHKSLTFSHSQVQRFELMLQYTVVSGNKQPVDCKHVSCESRDRVVSSGVFKRATGRCPPTIFSGV